MVMTTIMPADDKDRRLSQTRSDRIMVKLVNSPDCFDQIKYCRKSLPRCIIGLQFNNLRSRKKLSTDYQRITVTIATIFVGVRINHMRMLSMEDYYSLYIVLILGVVAISN